MSVLDQFVLPSTTPAAAAASAYCQSAAVGTRPRSRSAVLGVLSPSEQRQLLDIQRQRLGSGQTGQVECQTTFDAGNTGSRLSTPSRMTDFQFSMDAVPESAASPVAKSQAAVRSRSHSGGVGVGVGFLPDQRNMELMLLAQLQQQQLMEYVAAKTVAVSGQLDGQRQVNFGQVVETEDLRSASMLQHQQQPTTATTHASTDRFKTELCRSYAESGGTCRYGDKCQFAHGSAELRCVERHPRYKTELCKTFHSRGFCAYGPRCNFIHNVSETRLPTSALLEEIYLHPELYSALILPQLVGGLQTSGANNLSQVVPPSLSSGSSSRLQHQQQPLSWFGSEIGSSSATAGQHRRFSLDNQILTTSGLLAPQSPQRCFDVNSLTWQASMLTNPGNWAVGNPSAPLFAGDETFRSRSLSLGSAASRSMYSESSGSSSPGPPSPPCASGDIVDDLMQCMVASAEQVAAYLERYRRIHGGGVGASVIDSQPGPRLM